MHVRAHVLLKRLRLATGSGQLQKVAQPLRPRNRGGGRRLHESLWIDLLRKLRENRGHIAQAAGAMVVTHKIERGGLGR